MLGNYGWMTGITKNYQQELTKQNEKERTKAAKHICPYCGEPAWYIGLNLIECSNMECKWYCDKHNSSNDD